MAQSLKELRDTYSAGMEAGRTGAQAIGAIARNVRRLRSSGDDSGDGGDARDQHRTEEDSAPDEESGQGGEAEQDAKGNKGSKDSKDSDGGGGGPVKSSHIIEEHIDVGVPHMTAFQQWTSYKDFSRMTKAESAEAKRQDRVTFTSKIGPSRRSWQTEVVDQVPGRRIAWRSMGGAQTMGVVTFHKLDDRLTRVMVEMEYHPKGAFETVGNFFRMQRRRVRKDLKLFKNHIELKGEAKDSGGSRIKGGGLKDDTDDRLAGSSSGGSKGGDD